MPTLEAADKARGLVEYMGDLMVPGMAHAKIVRSPLPHARLVSIDASQARALRGVVCVLTRDEVLADPKHQWLSRNTDAIKKDIKQGDLQKIYEGLFDEP